MKQLRHTLPGDIERASMSIIASQLEAMGVQLAPELAPVVMRVIHTTADFEYVNNLCFTDGAVEKGVTALRVGADIVTDTNMARAGVSKPALKRLGGQVHCFMADEDVARAAREQATTRAAASMDKLAVLAPRGIAAVGNAPTALLRLVQLMEKGLRPALIIGVPVGFVNVVESKQLLLSACEQYGVPAIVSLGRKGGSNVAAAICNALLYLAAGMLDPADRGWQSQGKGEVK